MPLFTFFLNKSLLCLFNYIHISRNIPVTADIYTQKQPWLDVIFTQQNMRQILYTATTGDTNNTTLEPD